MKNLLGFRFIKFYFTSKVKYFVFLMIHQLIVGLTALAVLASSLQSERYYRPSGYSRPYGYGTNRSYSYYSNNGSYGGLYANPFSKVSQPSISDVYGYDDAYDPDSSSAVISGKVKFLVEQVDELR